MWKYNHMQDITIINIDSNENKDQRHAYLVLIVISTKLNRYLPAFIDRNKSSTSQHSTPKIT